jgi:hypothetical protein
MKLFSHSPHQTTPLVNTTATSHKFSKPTPTTSRVALAKSELREQKAGS